MNTKQLEKSAIQLNSLFSRIQNRNHRFDVKNAEKFFHHHKILERTIQPAIILQFNLC